MFKKLNTGKMVNGTVRPLLDYLVEQNKLLDEIGRVLAQENRAVSGRETDKINELTELKSKLMIKLQQNDQKIKLHPDCALLKTEFANHVRVLKVKLSECKRRNEVNGRLIALCLASCRRLSSVLMSARDKMTGSLTYTQKGGVNARSPLRLNIEA